MDKSSGRQCPFSQQYREIEIIPDWKMEEWCSSHMLDKKNFNAILNCYYEWTKAVGHCFRKETVLLKWTSKAGIGIRNIGATQVVRCGVLATSGNF